MTHFGRLHLILPAIVLCAEAATAANPVLGRLFPPGGQRGAEVEVRFHGQNLSDAVDLLFHSPGVERVTHEVISDGEFRAVLRIAEDCPLGPIPARVRTRTGLSNLRFFFVGALPEKIESEPNDTPEQSEKIPVGTTVNGTVSNEDIDYFKFDLTPGERLSVEVEALRLGVSLFDPKLRLIGPRGHELVVADDLNLTAQDAAFTHVADETGEYSVSISEAAYGGSGDAHYRLHIGKFPRPMTAAPLGGTEGATTEIRWIGDPMLSSQTVSIPTSPGFEKEPVFVSTDQGISPTPMHFRSIPHPGVFEAEPNNDRVQSTTGEAPGSFDGVLESAGDVDWFHFQGKADQEYEFQVWGRRLGSPIDSVLHVYKPDGGEILGVDDAKGPDSYGRVRLTEEGAHHIRVADHLGRGGPEFTYRVEVTPPQPLVELQFLNNEPVTLALPRGNRAIALLEARRTNVGGPIRVEVSGLPTGVTVEHPHFQEGQEVIPLLFTASAESELSGAMTEIRGTLQSGETEVPARFNQKVVLVFGNNLTEFWTHQVRSAALAVTDPAPFEILARQPKVPIVRQGQMQIEVTAARAEGFTGPIDLRVPWTPSGVGAATAQIPEGATRAMLTLDANSSAAIGIAKIAVTGSANGIVVSTPLIELEVEEPWVAFEVDRAETEQGKATQISAKVIRKATFEGEYQAEILGLPKGVTSELQTLSMATETLTFPLHTAVDSPPNKTTGLFVRTTLMKEGEPVLHQSGGGELRIYEPLPPPAEPEPTPTPVPADAPPAPERRTRFPST